MFVYFCVKRSTQLPSILDNEAKVYGLGFIVASVNGAVLPYCTAIDMICPGSPKSIT
jgi:hypothetical protein